MYKFWVGFKIGGGGFLDFFELGTGDGVEAVAVGGGAAVFYFCEVEGVLVEGDDVDFADFGAPVAV